MVFCTRCGGALQPADSFCGACGAQQTAKAAHKEGISAHTLSVLCYIPVIGWIACVAALAAPRYRNEATLRFHAFQGLYMFVFWLLIDWVVNPFLFIAGPGRGAERMLEASLKLFLIGAWIFMLIKTSQSERYSLPILGELAERSLAEQPRT